MLFFIAFPMWDLDPKIEPLPENIQISVISISEFDAKLSSAPNLIETATKQPTVIERVLKKPEFAVEISEPTSIDELEKIDLKINDKSFEATFDSQFVKIEKNRVVSLKKPKEISAPEINSINEVDGNERRSYSTPEIAKPKPRTADRIDKIAVSRSSSQKLVDDTKTATRLANDALKVQQISDAEAPKEASTKITPEGRKDTSIIVSGAVKRSLPPPSRPKTFQEINEPPVKRPKAAQLLKKNKQSDQIEMLLAELDSGSKQLTPEVSVIEKNNMMSAIAQKLAKYWEQGILAGNSNFEKYIVQVEVEVNSVGEIIGGVKPLEPRVPTGRYLIAFRQASNALISAATLPIIPGKYPSGITFEITFDPDEGFSF